MKTSCSPLIASIVVSCLFSAAQPTRPLQSMEGGRVRSTPFKTQSRASSAPQTLRADAHNLVNSPSYTLTFLDYYACTIPTAMTPDGLYITGNTDWGCDRYPPALFVYPITDALEFQCGPDCPPSSGTGIAEDPSGNVYVVGYNIPPPGSDFMEFSGTGYINVGLDGYSTIATDPSGGIYLLGGGATITKLNPQFETVYTSNLSAASPDAIAIDSKGNAYVTGSAGVGLPTTPGAIQSTGAGAFVARLDPTGTKWLYVTYLTGNVGGNQGYGIAVDGSGNAYVVGDGGFVTKVNPTGTAVVYSTRIAGTNGTTTAVGVAVDGHGGAHIVGSTSSTDFPVASPTQPWCGTDAFTSQLDQAGTSLVFSTCIGGSDWDGGVAIAVDKEGNATVTGETWSRDLPVTDRSYCVIYGGELCEAGFIATYGAFTTARVSKSSLSFPTQLVGTQSSVKQIALSNTGTAQMTVSDISTTGDFSQTNTCSKGVKPGTHCNIKIRFSPTGIGTRSGTLTISDNAPTSPQIVSLSGMGTIVSLSPNSLSFGPQPVRTQSAPQSATLTNYGNVALNISNIGVSGKAADFAVTTDCGTAVPAGASCTINVTFAPTAKGKRKAAVNIYDDGGASPQVVKLSGIGT